MGTAADQSVTADLNTALVGKGNEITVEVMPFLTRSGKSLRIGTVDMSAEVQCEDKPIADVEITEVEVDSAYRAWSERARKQWKGYLEWEKQWLKENPDSSSAVTARDGGALDSMRQWTARNRLSVSTTFDTEAGPDFSRVFEEAPVIEGTPSDTSRLKDYAMRLRDLMARKDTSGLVEEFRPSIEYAYRRGKRDGESLEEFVSMYREKLVLEGAEKELQFSREEVRLRKWSEGRVWGLRREGAEGLLRRIKVYVAELDGELKVVR
ncbi:hypothetical protein BSZ35_11525 [Salinibacter sp. 10B]|nr:hypothetical protein BSZ35_11525 [Salinibacter sp. 10B]